jgi:hypothetical protein
MTATHQRGPQDMHRNEAHAAPGLSSRSLAGAACFAELTVYDAARARLGRSSRALRCLSLGSVRG